MAGDQLYPYATHVDIKFPTLATGDAPALVRACRDRWYNQTLCQVNDSVVRLGVLQPQEGFVGPKGVMHPTRAPERAVILMVETSAIVPTGDA
jgi:hypothetical protein